jgi:bifunctional non-homologous end joining protein LigD
MPLPCRPMLASLEEAPLQSEHFAYEPKYDGIRTIVELGSSGGEGAVHLYSRLGNDKTSQFPEVARALRQFGSGIKAGVVLDGELVALDASGEPAGFQRLQGRIHLTRADDIGRAGGTVPVAFIAFDILRDGASDLTGLPLTARRARLERVFGNTGSPLLRLSEFVPLDGRALYQRALDRGWEGLVAKHLDSRYRAGRRSPDWRKLKITLEQEFVVAGWTEPRGSRDGFGALLLGVYDGRPAPSGRRASKGDLVYVGRAGTGFSEAELRRVLALLKPLETSTSPFRETPASNERPHWVRPQLIAQVRFTEWTGDGRLRHPVYLGLRDDVEPRSVEAEGGRRKAALTRPTRPNAERRTPNAEARPAAARRPSAAGRKPAADRRPPNAESREPPAAGRKPAAEVWRGPSGPRTAGGDLPAQLDAIETKRGEALVTLPDGLLLKVGNLDKVFWPASGLTKGDLLRYYAAVAHVLLPVLDDRPLVMKRLPNGVRGKSFYQQRAPDEVPAGVRVETLAGDTDVPSRLIGGSLISLLYMAQLAAISQDPWFSRVSSLACPDFVALDLDPMPGVTFEQVLDVARWVHEELEALGVPGFPKTSGADGLHVYVPLQPGTRYETAVLFCQLLATLVAQKHPKEATVVRNVQSRGRRVYVDYLQNVRGKTLACAYSARGSDFAGVSTPLAWKEVDEGVEREAFTIETVPRRLAKVGDLWAGLRQAEGVDLREIVKARG